VLAALATAEIDLALGWQAVFGDIDLAHATEQRRQASAIRIGGLRN
jgi:hypothetical protein